MFIINIGDIKRKLNLFCCDKHKAHHLQENGFALFGRENEDYYFYRTNALIDFLELEGGENNE